MWLKQCHLHHPPVITILIGAMFIYVSYSQMGCKHGIVFTLLPLLIGYYGDYNVDITMIINNEQLLFINNINNIT